MFGGVALEDEDILEQAERYMRDKAWVNDELDPLLLPSDLRLSLYLVAVVHINDTQIHEYLKSLIDDNNDQSRRMRKEDREKIRLAFEIKMGKSIISSLMPRIIIG